MVDKALDASKSNANFEDKIQEPKLKGRGLLVIEVRRFLRRATRSLTWKRKRMGVDWSGGLDTWLPDGYSQIFRSYVFGPSGLWTMAPLHCAAKFVMWQLCRPTIKSLCLSSLSLGTFIL